MRLFMRVLLASLAVVLAACTPTAPPATDTPEAAVSTEAPTSSFAGSFTAMSTTAMGVTGDMDVSADVLSFGRGFRIEGASIASELTGDTDLSAGGGTVNSGSGMQVTAVELRRVELVRFAADAPSPNLCGDAQASYVILGRGGDAVTLQVFSGGDAPGPNAHDTQLCGIYNYMPG